MDFSSPPSTGDPSRESIAQCPTSDLQLPHLGTCPQQQIPGLGLIQHEPQIIHYDHAQRTFRREGDPGRITLALLGLATPVLFVDVTVLLTSSTETDYVFHNSTVHRDEKSDVEITQIKAREPNPNEASASYCDVAAKDPRKRVLFDFMSRTPSSTAFDKYEEKQLKRPCHPFEDSTGPVGEVHHTGSQLEAVNAGGAYPRRPFQGTDFNLSEQAAQSDAAQPVSRPHVQATQAQVTQLTGIADRIATVIELLRHSDDQLSDAYDRMSEADLAIEELRTGMQRSWEKIQSQASDPRDREASNASGTTTPASSDSFADIEAKLKDITRQKRLIEMEITGRESKRQRIEEAFAAFVPTQGLPGLERLEETADEYVPAHSGL
ncbi:hypothetical protein K4K56_005467 [Colletotrichum sp. SAR 10_98]|nr:hypothetical protein K4K56_005467 [Colletotrichum sp. SAR 10_98]